MLIAIAIKSVTRKSKQDKWKQNPEYYHEYYKRNAEKKKLQVKNWKLNNPDLNRLHECNVNLRRSGKQPIKLDGRIGNPNWCCYPPNPLPFQRRWLRYTSAPLEKMPKIILCAMVILIGNKKRLAEQNKRYNKKYHQTPVYKVAASQRSRLRMGLKLQGDFTKKGCKVRTNFGCSPSQLRKHIENQWSSKMSWGNYGIFWVIDHILPCAKFDLTKQSEIDICFNWQNLRPLGKLINKQKSDTITDPQQPLPLSL